MRGWDRELGWLRVRMAVPAMAGLLAVAAAGWMALERTFGESSDAQARVAVRAAADTFGLLVRTSTEELATTLGALEANPELTAALAAGDFRRLLAAGGPIFRELQRRHGVTHWSYWELEPPGEAPRGLRNVARLGTPTRRGDVVERETLARAARDRALSAGIELGYTGFGLRVVAPVRDRGRVVGYAELGREVEALLADVKRRTGDDFAVVLDKRRLDPRRWAAHRAAHGERDDWSDRERLLVVHSASVHAGLLADLALPDAVPDDGGALGVRGDGGRAFAVGAFPLADASGGKVGAIYVFRDVTELAAEAAAHRRVALGALAVAFAVAAIAMAFAFEWLVIRPRRAAAPPDDPDDDDRDDAEDGRGGARAAS